MVVFLAYRILPNTKNTAIVNTVTKVPPLKIEIIGRNEQHE